MGDGGAVMLAVGVREVLDAWFRARLGADPSALAAGEVVVVPCERRRTREAGYGFSRVLWALRAGGGVVVSAHPDVVELITTLADGLTPEEILGEAFLEAARRVLSKVVPAAELSVGGPSVNLVHPGGAQPLAPDVVIRPLVPGERDTWPGVRVYNRAANHPSAQRGDAFGLFLGATLVAELMTHDPAVAEFADRVAEEGIEVAEPYRRQGHGQALLAHWTCEMQRRGRVCVHTTWPANTASLALAHSLGYVDYAFSRSVNRRWDD